MFKLVVLTLSLFASSFAMAQNQAQPALSGLVGIFGEVLGPAKIYSDLNPPNCKVYVNFLEDGASGRLAPAPGVRISVETYQYFLVVPYLTARGDFQAPSAAFLTGGGIDQNGVITLTNTAGSTLTVYQTASGADVTVDGVSCAEQGWTL